MNHFRFSVLFFSFFTFFAQAGFASNTSVIRPHVYALNLLKSKNIAPPKFAYILSLANEAAIRSSQAVTPILKESAYEFGFKQMLRATLGIPLESPPLLMGNVNTVVIALYNYIQSDFANRSASLGQLWPTTLKSEFWMPTLPAYAQPMFPNWGAGKLWSAVKASDYTDDLIHPVYKSGAYLKDLEEVEALGSKDSKTRSDDQTKIALFWAAGTGTVTPVGIWNVIAIEEIVRANLTFEKAALLMSTLNKALSDAGTLAWRVKFDQLNTTCRPINAVQHLKNKNWLPLLETPPFPSYVSGHSTFSAAAAAVLASYFGRHPIAVHSEAFPGYSKTFVDYYQAAEEAGISRIYGGIHFSADNVDGLKLGQKIGCSIVNQMMKIGCK